MSTVAEMAGSADPAAFVRPAAVPADSRGRGTAKAKGEAGDAFDSQLDAELARPVEDRAESDRPLEGRKDSHEGHQAAAKGRVSTDDPESDTAEAMTPQTPVILAFNPWVPVARDAEPAAHERQDAAAPATEASDLTATPQVSTGDVAIAAPAAAENVQGAVPDVAVTVPSKSQETAPNGERSERPERPERSEPSERPERPERPERFERPERSEPSERPERPERPDSNNGLHVARRVRAGRPDSPGLEHARDVQATNGSAPRETVADSVPQGPQPGSNVVSGFSRTSPETNVASGFSRPGPAGISRHAQAQPEGPARAESGEARRKELESPTPVDTPTQVQASTAALVAPRVHEVSASPLAAPATHHGAVPVAAGASPALETEVAPGAFANASAAVPEPDTPDRLVQSLRFQFLKGGGDAVVQLRPEHLGPVTISVRVEQGSVSARIVAADPVVAEWLQAHQQTLRDGLQANGLVLDRLVVDRDGKSPDRRDRREPPARERFRAPAEPQSTFELTI